MKKPFIPDWFISSGFNHYQLAILVYVACRGRCFESKNTIWTKLGIGNKTFNRTVKELVEHGWLKQTWVNRKRCLELTMNGKPISNVKSDMVSIDTKYLVSSDTTNMVSIDTTNVSRELINTTNQGTVQGDCIEKRQELSARIWQVAQSKRLKLPRATKEERERHINGQ